MTTGAVIENQRRSLLIYAQRHGISEACRAFQVSRTTFYKIKTQLLKTGSLAPKPDTVLNFVFMSHTLYIVSWRTYGKVKVQTGATG
jgi:hypothetical protein